MFWSVGAQAVLPGVGAALSGATGADVTAAPALGGVGLGVGAGVQTGVNSGVNATAPVNGSANGTLGLGADAGVGASGNAGSADNPGLVTGVRAGNNSRVRCLTTGRC